MGASEWEYHVPYLWAEETAQELGTHSILDVYQVADGGDAPYYGEVQPVTEAAAIERLGVAKLTRAHVDALHPLARERQIGRCSMSGRAARRLPGRLPPHRRRARTADPRHAGRL